MAWPISFTNKIKLIAEAFEKLWEIIEDNPVMYVVFIRRKDSNKKIFMAEKEEGVKVVRVFLSETDAQNYCKTQAEKSKAEIYVAPMRHDSIYNSVVFINGTGENIECLLTALDTDGNVYDIEVIWSANIN